MARGARVRLERPSAAASSRRSLNTLIQAAVNNVFDSCRMEDSFGQIDHDVGFVEISAPDGDGDTPSLQFVARSFHSFTLHWDQLEDAATARAREVEAAHAASRAAQEARADESAQAEALRQNYEAEKAQAAQRAEVEEKSRQARITMTHILRVSTPWVFVALLGIWAIVNHQALARLYFFAFHPHPARAQVARALKSSMTLEADARSLAHSLSELPPGSSTLRAVRLAQAEKLFHQLQTATAAKQRELEQRARRNAARAHEEAAFYGLQEAIALAAAALARAKAAQVAAASMKGEYQ